MSFVLFELKESVGIIRLNRPDKLNSFNREMALELQAALDECKKKEVRCVYIIGEGKGFSAGQDLAEVVDPNGPGMARILSEHYNPIVTRIRKLEKPVVAAVNGVAAGAGANIALCCDIVVAALRGRSPGRLCRAAVGIAACAFPPSLIDFRSPSPVDSVTQTRLQRIRLHTRALGGPCYTRWQRGTHADEDRDAGCRVRGSAARHRDGG